MLPTLITLLTRKLQRCQLFLQTLSQHNSLLCSMWILVFTKQPDLNDSRWIIDLINLHARCQTRVMCENCDSTRLLRKVQTTKSFHRCTDMRCDRELADQHDPKGNPKRNGGSGSSAHILPRSTVNTSLTGPTLSSSISTHLHVVRSRLCSCWASVLSVVNKVGYNCAFNSIRLPFVCQAANYSNRTRAVLAPSTARAHAGFTEV